MQFELQKDRRQQCPLGRLNMLFATLLCGTTLVVGCISSSAENQAISAVHSRNDSNIKRVSNLYSSFWNTHGGQGPKDQKALEDYAKTMPSEQTEWMGIDKANPASIFVSERDHKPFKVRWSVPGDKFKIDALVFEDMGVEGKRMVGFTGGHIEQPDSKRYEELWEHGGTLLGAKANQAFEEAVPTNPNSK